MESSINLRFRYNRIFVICVMLIFFRRSIAVILDYVFHFTGGRQLTYFVSLALLLIAVLCKQKFKLYTSYIVLLYMLVLYIVSMILVPNEYVIEYFRIFYMYIMVGCISILSTEDTDNLIKVFCWWSVVLFVLCAPIPFLSGSIGYIDMGPFSSGMAYGEWVMTPAFIALYLLRKKYHYGFMIVPEVICVLITFVYANRGSLLSIISFVMVYEIFFKRDHSRKTIIKWSLIMLVGIILFFQLENILLFIQNRILIPRGISSRTITKFLEFLMSDSRDFSDVSRGRVNTGIAAQNYLQEHLLFGIGIGKFRIETGHAYTHNFFTDVLTTFGLVGAIPIFLMTIKACMNTFREKNDSFRLLLFIFFAQCFPRMLVSQTFLIDVTFWMFIVLALRGNIRQEGIF